MRKSLKVKYTFPLPPRKNFCLVSLYVLSSQIVGILAFDLSTSTLKNLTITYILVVEKNLNFCQHDKQYKCNTKNLIDSQNGVFITEKVDKLSLEK